jgi:hypothetical protein
MVGKGMKQSPTRSRKKLSRISAIGWSLFLFMLVGGLGSLIAYEPTFQGLPILGLTTVWTLALAIGVAGFCNAIKRNWLASFVLSLWVALDRCPGWWLLVCLGASLPESRSRKKTQR